MGGVMSKLGSVFNPTISGTGQTAGELSKIGYGPSDLAKLDPRRALLKGTVGGIGKGLQDASPSAVAGPGPAYTAPVMSPVDPRYFQPQDFSGAYAGRPNPAIYG